MDIRTTPIPTDADEQLDLFGGQPLPVSTPAVAGQPAAVEVEGEL